MPSILRRLPFLSVVFLAWLLPSPAATLKPETSQAWTNYVTAAEAQTIRHARCSPALLDLSPDLRAQLREGDIIVYPAIRKGSVPVPSGLIHDWTGFLFIPHASLEQVIASSRDYSQYPEFYKPSVVDGHLISSGSSLDRFSLLMRQKVLSVNTGLYGEYRTTFHRVDANHFYTFTASDKLQEVQHGDDNSREERLPPDQGNGLIWRLHSTLLYEQADGGVYVQLEALALSRTVPASVAWIVNPVVSKISKAALTVTLKQTRESVSQPQLAANLPHH